jgi:hypothetical protein
MRKPLLLTLVCLLLISGPGNGQAQTARRRTGQPARSANLTAAADLRVLIDARDGELFGSFNGRTWLDAVKTMPLVKEGTTFRLYSLTGQIGTGVINQPRMEEYPCDELVEVAVSSLPEGEGDVMGVNGSWNAQPRLPKVQSTDQQEYSMVVSNYLKGAGVRNPKVKILQLLRVDLDGDGTEEVLISANSSEKPSMFMSRGDFSVVLLRRVTQGRAHTIPVVSEVELKTHAEPFQTGRWHHIETVAAILDINNDGVMEVITTYQSVYDGGKSVYDVKGIKPKMVLWWGCSGGH